MYFTTRQNTKFDKSSISTKCVLIKVTFQNLPFFKWTEYVVIEKGWINSVDNLYDDALLCSIAIMNVVELPFNNFRLKTTPR